MKRFISCFLSVALLLVSVWGTMVIGSAITESSALEMAENWTVYDGATTKLNAEGTLAGSWAKVTKNTDAEYIKSGADSLKFYSTAQQAATVLNVNKNKNYEIVFNYYATSVKTSGEKSYAVSRLTVQTLNGTTGWNSNDNLSLVAYNTSYTGPYNQQVSNTNTTVNSAVNQWNQLSISFNSGDNTQVVFAIMMGVDNVYVDDFALVEKTDGDNSLEDISNWKAVSGGYNISGAKNLPGYTNGAEQNNGTGWGTPSRNNDTAYIKAGNNSIKINGNDHYMYVMLPNVEKNKDYVLKFSYYGDYVNASSGKIFTRYGVYNPNVSGATIATTKKAYLKIVENEQVTAKAWKDVTLEFNSGDATELALIFNIAMGAKPAGATGLEFTAFVDEIVFEERVAAPSYDNELENINNWKVIKGNYSSAGDKNIPGYTNGGEYATSSEWYTTTSNTDTNYIKKGNNSIKINGNGTYTYLTLPTVEKNKDYVLTFEYYGDYVNANGNKIFNRYGVYNPNVSGATIATTKKAYLKIVENEQVTAKAWKDVTLEFNSGDATELVLIFNIAMGAKPASTTGLEFTAFVDNMALTPKNNTPLPPPSYTINEAGAWKIYKSSSANIGEGGILADAWASVADNTNAAFIKEGTTSLNFSCISQRGATEFAVEKNQDYTVSLKYYSDSLNSAGTYILSQIAVMKPNGIAGYNSNDNIACVYGSSSYTGPWDNKVSTTTTVGTTATTETGWHDIKFGFNSGDNEKLALTILFATSPVYIDDIKIEKGTYQPPEKDYGTPEKQKVIDFENNALNYSYTRGIDVATTAGYNGQQTKALHTVAGEYSSALFLNYSTTTADTDPIYTLPVKENKVYELSWRVKITKDSFPKAEDRWIAFYKYYNGGYVNIANVTNAKQGQWLEYKVIVITEKKQNRLSFTFNVGKNAPEIFVDDITLFETDYIAFEGYNGVNEKVVVNFDDFLVPLDMTDRMEVVKGPANDGKITNALHVKKGVYESATFLNYTGTTNNTDPVFSIPVKENTLYKIKFSLYIPEAKDAEREYFEWFSAYYDYASKGGINLHGLDDVKKVRNEWLQFEVSFVTKQGQNIISFCFNASKVHPEFYMDDIILQEMLPGVLSNTNLSYCEYPYDVLKSSDLDASAINASKTSVTKVQVNAQQVYTFAATVNGGNSSDSVFISIDGINPIGKSNDEVTATSVITGGKTKRIAYQFVTNASGYVYVVVKNNSNTLTLRDVTLFKSHSISSNRDMGRELNPNISSEAPQITSLSVIGDGSNPFDTDNPSTGDNSILPIVLILFTTALFMVLIVVKIDKKEDRIHE